MRILLVEDEDRIASFIEKGLAGEGHAVERVSTVSDAISLGITLEFDTVLLDLMLPDGDGRDALREIRKKRPELPIIVVSALGDIDEKVSLLDAGADDYLVKPFAFAELSARIRANARQGRSSSHVLEAGALTLDTRTRVARNHDLRIDLPSREFSLLEYLMRNAGRVLTRQQILDAVWGYGFDTESNVVDVYVGYLRRKLDLPDPPSVIETVRGAGYRVRD